MSNPGTRASCPPINELRAGRPRSQHKSWHSRGYLPHFDHPGLIQSITFRLADSVPATVIENWRTELKLTGHETADDQRNVELRKRIEHYADQGKGACWLNDPVAAEIVESALLHFDSQRYRLLAWCVMPNHVHVLIETLPGFPLFDVVQSWKSFTAKECNRHLGRKGTFWMPEYYDRYIRDARHLRAVTEYIHNNPVKANLCGSTDDWPWSRAGIAGVPPALSEAGKMPALPESSLLTHLTYGLT